MNGEPLTRAHGAPLRLVVPGWYGMAAVKWLKEIRVLTRPFSGHFQTERYVYLDEAGTPQGTPVREMRVRALICLPGDGDALGAGAARIEGIAWSGAARVVEVQVSTDGGRSWAPARLDAQEGGSVRWSLEWSPPGAGGYEIVARARDATGAMQPLEPVWNAQGYGNNVVHRIRVRVA
jgi:DMSO/TMAO reductase YedYZ molybdopterin-dependent catalytic subunit